MVAGGGLGAGVEGGQVAGLGGLLELGGQAREEARFRGVGGLLGGLLQFRGGVGGYFRELGGVGGFELLELLKQLGNLGEADTVGRGRACCGGGGSGRRRGGWVADLV